MARVRQTVKTTRRKGRRKKNNSPDFIVCNVCGGRGKIRNWHKTKGKKK